MGLILQLKRARHFDGLKITFLTKIIFFFLLNALTLSFLKIFSEFIAETPLPFFFILLTFIFFHKASFTNKYY